MKHILVILSSFLLSLSSYAQVSSTLFVQSTSIGQDFKEAGYKGGVGFGADLMYSPLRMNAPIQFEVGPDVRFSTAGGESTLMQLTEEGSASAVEEKYKIRNEHLSMEIKARILLGPSRFKVYGDIFKGVRMFDSDLKIKPIDLAYSVDPNEAGHVYASDANYWGYGGGVLWQVTNNFYLNGGARFVKGQNMSFVDLGSVTSSGSEFEYEIGKSANSNMLMFSIGAYFHINNMVPNSVKNFESVEFFDNN